MEERHQRGAVNSLSKSGKLRLSDLIWQMTILVERQKEGKDKDKKESFKSLAILKQAMDIPNIATGVFVFPNISKNQETVLKVSLLLNLNLLVFHILLHWENKKNITNCHVVLTTTVN